MFEEIYKKLSLFHWNIGFTSFKGDSSFELNSVSWLKHNYKDRFFADPFILSNNGSEIEVLVEEFFYKTWRGIITLLIVDSSSFELKERKAILDIDTHLSFPAIYREEGDVYIYPENSESGCLTLYKYSSDSRELEFVSVILEDKAVDPILFKEDGKYYITCSLAGKKEQENLYLYSSDSLTGPFVLESEEPIKSDISSGRNAGDFFMHNGVRVRPTQICKSNYGEGLTMLSVESVHPFVEKQLATFRGEGEYKYGFHTCNKSGDLIVVDGLAFIFNPLAKLNKQILSRFKKQWI